MRLSGNTCLIARSLSDSPQVSVPRLASRPVHAIALQPVAKQSGEDGFMKLLSTLVLCVAIALTLASSPCAFAQATVSFAQLNGTILDSSGRAVAGASLTLRDMATNRTYTAVTSSSGFYLVPTLPPGQYELTVQNPGFGKYVRSGIMLSVGQTATVDVTLKVASVS